MEIHSSPPILYYGFKVARAWRETTPVCSGLTRLGRAGYSRHDSGASRERARIMWRAQDVSVHMQRSLPSSSYPARSTLRRILDSGNDEGVQWVISSMVLEAGVGNVSSNFKAKV